MDELKKLDAEYLADHRVMRSLVDRMQGLYDALLVTGRAYLERVKAGAL